METRRNAKQEEGRPMLPALERTNGRAGETAKCERTAVLRLDDEGNVWASRNRTWVKRKMRHKAGLEKSEGWEESQRAGVKHAPEHAG